MARFPQDQFDEPPADLARVGAHRAPPRRGRGWIALGWAALATVALVLAGLYGLSRLNPDFEIPLPEFGAPTAGPTVAPLPTAEPLTDPEAVPEGLSLTLSVLNASPTASQQNVVGDLVEGAGWPDPVRASAAAHDIEETVVYYHSADYEGIARGLVELLGTGRVVLSDAYPGAPVTIVVGSDFTPPAGG